MAETETPIRFDDGALYEQGMGRWSRLVGEVFLDWLAVQPGSRWLDVGCGSGALTELVLQRCAPAEVHGIDPSEAQLVYARTRPGARGATFQAGDATALPFPEGRFDAAVMGLVIFFVPDPAKGTAEMARVVRPGGVVASYAWDMLGGGSPFEPMFQEMRALGKTPPRPPSIEASSLDALRALWAGAGLQAIETRTFTVERSFADFDEFWVSPSASISARTMLDTISQDEMERLKERVRARLPAAAGGRITYSARANAVKGTVPR